MSSGKIGEKKEVGLFKGKNIMRSRSCRCILSEGRYIYRLSEETKREHISLDLLIISEECVFVGIHLCYSTQCPQF